MIEFNAIMSTLQQNMVNIKAIDTISDYLLPSGVCPQGRPVMPDNLTPDEDEASDCIGRFILFKKKYLLIRTVSCPVFQQQAHYCVTCS